jgi:hypothetical protein
MLLILMHSLGETTAMSTDASAAIAHRKSDTNLYNTLLYINILK